MQLLWSEYASSVLELHYIQSPPSLVIVLYTILATQQAAKSIVAPSIERNQVYFGPTTTNNISDSVTQLRTILHHSDVPNELLVPPTTTTTTDTDKISSSNSSPRLIIPNPTISHALKSAQLLLTHYLAAACCEIFVKLQTMDCLPLLRSLIARPRDKVPAFLITCPPEVDEMIQARRQCNCIDINHTHDSNDNVTNKRPRPLSLVTIDTLDSWEYIETSINETNQLTLNHDLKSPSPSLNDIPNTIMPNWFTDPRATPLDRLAALLRRELASSTYMLLHSLISAGLTQIRTQRLYDMILRAVRLFAYMSHMSPHLRWTWTDLEGSQFDPCGMKIVNEVPSNVSVESLRVLFSVYPGLVLDNPSTSTVEVLVPERVFVIINSSSHCSKSFNIDLPHPTTPVPNLQPNSDIVTSGHLCVQVPIPELNHINDTAIHLHSIAVSPLENKEITSSPTQSKSDRVRKLSIITSPFSIWASMGPIVSPTHDTSSSYDSDIHNLSEPDLNTIPTSLDDPEPSDDNTIPSHEIRPTISTSFPIPPSHMDISDFHGEEVKPLPNLPISSDIMARPIPTYNPVELLYSPQVSSPLANKPQEVRNSPNPSARLLEAVLLAVDVIRSHTPTSSCVNSAVTTPIHSPKVLLYPSFDNNNNNLTESLLHSPLSSLPNEEKDVGEQLRKWLSETESTLVGHELNSLPQTNSVVNVIGCHVTNSCRPVKHKQSRKSTTFMMENIVSVYNDDTVEESSNDSSGGSIADIPN